MRSVKLVSLDEPLEVFFKTAMRISPAKIRSPEVSIPTVKTCDIKTWIELIIVFIFLNIEALIHSKPTWKNFT